MSATIKANATDLKAVAPRTIEAKKAWIASKVAIHDTVLYLLYFYFEKIRQCKASYLIKTSSGFFNLKGFDSFCFIFLIIPSLEDSIVSTTV